MTDRPTLLLDGDDTLWSTQPIYDDAKEALYALVARAGLDEDAARAEFDALDLANVDRLGFSADRFPTSMREMVAALAARAGQPPDEALEADAERIGRATHSRTPVLDPDATSVLTRLSTAYDLVLYTMGDPEIQHRRIAALGLRPLVHRVVVPTRKTAGELRRTVTSLRLDPASTWVVGNSLRSDIEPALAAGLRAVWLVRDTWAYDHAPDPPSGIPVIHTLGELPEVLAVTSA